MTRDRARAIVHCLLWQDKVEIDPIDKAEALQVASEALKPPNPMLDALRPFLPIDHPEYAR